MHTEEGNQQMHWAEPLVEQQPATSFIFRMSYKKYKNLYKLSNQQLHIAQGPGWNNNRYKIEIEIQIQNQLVHCSGPWVEQQPARATLNHLHGRPRPG